MSGEASLENLLSKLEDSALDVNSKAKAAFELRDSLDSWAHGGTQTYAHFLEKGIPIFLGLLDAPPVFDSTLPEQKLRSCILEVLHRLPLASNINGSIAFQVADKLINLIPIDNEDNDILIIKTVMQLLTSHTRIMKERVQHLLDIIIKMFQIMTETVNQVFDPSSASTSAAPNLPNGASTPAPPFSNSPHPSSPASTINNELAPEQQQNRYLAKGMQSFKVLAECPIVVVGIFTSEDRSIAPRNLTSFISQIKNTLMLQAPPQEKAHAEAASRGQVHIGICKEIKNKAAFGDLIHMQVKTMSFLAYLLRVESGRLTDFMPELPAIVVRMLKDCPRERSGSRKELLVAVRHIVNFNFRKIFLPVLDDLLDDQILIGDGFTVYESMRPLAYSMLADLIHHLREHLNQAQMRKAIHVYIRNFHDDYPGTSFQTMSAKILINLADFMAKLDSKQEARYLFMIIFKAIAEKFREMNHKFDNAMKNIKPRALTPMGDLAVENYLADKDCPPGWDEVSIFNAAPIKTQAPRDKSSNVLHDTQFLLKNLVSGLKNLFAVLKNTNPAPLKRESDSISFPLNWGDISFGFSSEEVDIFIQLFHEGIKVFRYYDPTGENHPSEVANLTAAELLTHQYMMHVSKEEKELLETFGTIFHFIDTATFHEIFLSEIPHLYEMCFIHPPVVHIAQFLLASEATSPSFCGMLMDFLMTKMNDVGVADVKKASSLLRLFKLSFMAVTLFFQKNESILRPHLTKIVTQSIQLSTTAEEPINYFVLLRSLFRSIGGGKFENLYKEILPLLEMVLDVLNNLLSTARKPFDRDLYVELILTVPARLSNLLPLLNYLMRPLIVALESGGDLVGQGLRTVELCIDNFTEAYLDPIMKPYIEDLMPALWGHLRPSPYSHYQSHTAMRILGKLGGRNRQFITGINKLDYKLYSDDDWSYGIKLIGASKEKAFPAKIGVEAICAKLKENPAKIKDQQKAAVAKASDSFYKRQAFRFVQAQIKLLLKLDNLPEDFGHLVRLQVSDLLNSKFDVGEDILTTPERDKSLAKRDAQHDTLKKLIQTCHYVHSIDYLKDEASSFLSNLCQHFMLLEVGKTFAICKHKPKPFDPNSGQGPVYIDSKVIVDAVSDSLTSDFVEEREAAQTTILRLWEAGGIVLGNKDKIDRLPIFVQMVKNFTHSCYQSLWYAKMSGVLGLKIVVTQLPYCDQWLLDKHLDIVRALTFVLKDTPQDSTALPRLEAEAILEILIPKVAKSFTPADLDKDGSKFRNLNKTLIQDLSHSNRNARTVVQRLYKLLAETVKMDIADILRPSKEVLLTPIFNKPIRTIPLDHQIGCLDALNFCMKLEGKIVPHDDSLIRLINEVALLLDADAEALTHKHNEYRHTELVTQIRSCCMRLMTTIIVASDSTIMAPNTALWNRILTIFFNWLYDKNPEVTEAAREALKAVIAGNNRFPKEVLHNGLKPILTSLQEWKKLSVECLEGFSKLLRLLTTYFKVEIGQRLLDHTKNLNPSILQQASFSLPDSSAPLEILAAIFNVFHLLPPAADKYLKEIIEKVMDLESSLRRTRFSLFREPLIKFFNLYPKSTIEFFYPKLQILKYGRFFAQILQHPDSGPLRTFVYGSGSRLLTEITIDKNVRAQNDYAKAVQDSREKIEKASEEGSNIDIETLTKPENIPKPDKYGKGDVERAYYTGVVNGIHVAYALSKFENTSNFLFKNDGLRKALFTGGQKIIPQVRACEKQEDDKIVKKNDEDEDKDKTMNQASDEFKLDTTLRLAGEQACSYLTQLLYQVLSEDLKAHDLEFFFRVIEALTSGLLKVDIFFFKLIYKSILTSNDIGLARLIVKECIDHYRKQSVPQKMKAFIFRYIVIPIFAYDAQCHWDQIFTEGKGTELFDQAMVKLVIDKLWRPNASDINEDSALYIDHARLELLQLTALLLKYHEKFIQIERKDVIKFSWNWVKLEDVITKHSAYVVIGYFIHFYDTPPKITISVYSTLLKAHQNESKPLVTQALELLAPVLKKRVSEVEQKVGVSAKIPKKIITEESSNLGQLMSIFSFFYRQPDLFYDSRAYLTPIIIPHLPKVAQLNNEGKRTSLSLVSMIWDWEEKAYREHIGSPVGSPMRGVKRKGDGSPTISSEDRSWSSVPNLQMRSMMIKHLAGFASQLVEKYPVPSYQLHEKFTNKLPTQITSNSSDFTRRAVDLLRKFLSPPFWSDVDFIAFIPRLINSTLIKEKSDDEKKDIREIKMINTLQVLKVCVNLKSDEWVLDDIADLSSYISKVMKSEDPQFQDCLHAEDDQDKSIIPLLRRMLDVLPPAPSMEVDETDDTPPGAFLTMVHTTITNALASNHLVCGVNMLSTLCKALPKEVDRHMDSLLKVFQTKLVKDHLVFQTTKVHPTQQGSVAVASRPDASQTPATNEELYENEILTGLIIKTIDIMASRIEHLGDHRRPFLTILANSLIEKSRNEVICSKILDLVEGWIFNNDVIPTLKEKVAVLTKMLVFESRPEFSDLNKRFLGLILRIYDDSRVTRTELTVRLEQPFLVGTRATDIDLRNKFLTIMDRHISRTPSVRIDALINGQDWTPLGETFWLAQVNHLLCGALELNSSFSLHSDDFKTLSPLKYYGSFSGDSRLDDLIVDDEYSEWISLYKKFTSDALDIKLKDIMEPLCQIQHTDNELASSIWIALFPIFWSNIPKDDRPEFEQSMASILTKDFHHRQLEMRPNCIQTLVEGIVRAHPRMKAPPHICKDLGKTYNVWYPTLHYLEEAAVNPLVDTPVARESLLDALLDVYASLDETDMFYGTWRRRCQYVETNAALSYEQIGLWDRAQLMYENAQVKVRTGALTFSQGEYTLWEDHWVLCAQKLQQWDILGEYAKHENFNDLYIEAMWRNQDHWTEQSDREQFDSMIKSVSDALTPRRAYFLSFMNYLKLHWSNAEDRTELTRSIEEATQISIRKWHQLPSRITNAHIAHLQNFQHILELYDAQAVTNILNSANLSNLESKSVDLKHLFIQWRDRLPSFWDDINAWQDLVTWRTHVFTLVNKVFLPIINNSTQNQGNASQYSYAYRGYHEQAWIINRFAHVARQHDLTDVSAAHLNKIYTLPNIEIQEAFIKLREQAKCHYQKNELSNGLDVINNTNLNYFSGVQKSEFYTLKGMFLNKLDQKSEADEAFGLALWYDIRLPKAWAEWARYNDSLFKKEKDISKAASAIACYLEASSCYKSGKCRKFLARILWLLSLDNQERSCAKAVAEFKGEQPYWYWITFIPQLLLSLSRPETAVIARSILGNIAKLYPQALHFQLRTNREDLLMVKRQQDAKERELKAKQEKANAAAAASQTAPSPAANGTPKATDTPTLENVSGSRPGTANGQANGASTNTAVEGDSNSKAPKATESSAARNNGEQNDKQLKAWEHSDLVLNALKASHALLYFSMESMAENLTRNLKSSQDEDAHRLIVALLNDGINYVSRQPSLYANESKLPPQTETNISRFAREVCPSHVRAQFEQDFVKIKPSMREYIEKLRKWRVRLEERLDRRPNPAQLENMAPILIEFPSHKLDEIEIPGQYLEHKDKNTDFVRLDRFFPDVDLVRGAQASGRRLKIRGHDGGIHYFFIQTPTNRYARREERIMQLFRLFNDNLVKKRETRRRYLNFNLPLTIPLSPQVRLIQDDASNITLVGVYEDWCRKNEVQSYDPVLFHVEKLSETAQLSALQTQRVPGKPQTEEERKAQDYLTQMRLETYLAITETKVPNTVALEYFRAIYPSYADFWLFRRTFSYQLAALSFMNFILFMSSRQPQKFIISRSTGKVVGTELYPTMGAPRPMFSNQDPVSFRLTPNMQMLMGPISTEGVFGPSIQVIARALVEPDGEMEMVLSLFVKDEVQYWFSVSPRAVQNLAQQQEQANGLTSGGMDLLLRGSVQSNCEQVIRKATALAKSPDGQNLPANQTIVDQIASCVNPQKLALCEPLWMAWL